LFDQPTRLGDVDSHLLDQTRPEDALPPQDVATDQERFLDAATEMAPLPYHRHAQGHADDEATRMAHIDGKKRRQPPPPRGPTGEERTRALDINNDPNTNTNINDVDWDID
jgi:hypothetical protein